MHAAGPGLRSLFFLSKRSHSCSITGVNISGVAYTPLWSSENGVSGVGQPLWAPGGGPHTTRMVWRVTWAEALERWRHRSRC
eukprot:349023-Pelagomonas_calceolata.AAC.1